MRRKRQPRRNISQPKEADKQSGNEDRGDSLLVSLALRLAHCLFHDNEEIVLEAARAMGKLFTVSGRG